MDYHVIIEPADSEKIEFTTASTGNDPANDHDHDHIQKFEFKMNSLNDGALERDQNARCEMRLEGVIDDHNRETTGKLADWAMRTRNLYATVTVELTASNDASMTLRRYIFDKMFCVDYEETYENSDTDGSDAGKFTLFMAQGPHYKKRTLVSV